MAETTKMVDKTCILGWLQIEDLMWMIYNKKWTETIFCKNNKSIGQLKWVSLVCKAATVSVCQTASRALALMKKNASRLACKETNTGN